MICLLQHQFVGILMGPLLVLVSPCFRENAMVTCKIVSFLCRVDNFLLKNVIVSFFFSFFWNQISKWRSFEKKAILTYLVIFFSHQGKAQKFLQHMSHLRTYTYFAHPIDFFCPSQFCKNCKFIMSCMVSLWCNSWCWFLFASFWSIQ